MKKFFYRVKSNDTILSLSEKFSIPFNKIIADNSLKEEVREGYVLYLEQDESKRLYTVTVKDAVSSDLETDGAQKEKVLKENGVPYLFFGLKLYL